MEETKGLKKAEIKSEDSKDGTLNKYKISYKSIWFILGLSIIIPISIYVYKQKSKEFNLNHYDYIIVGAGLYGATFNYLAKKQGKKTLVLERRNVAGGNLYCDKVDDIFIHKYGPHVFHTNNKTVWDFVNSLVEFTPYITQPVAKVNNKIYTLPYNMWTFNQIWGVNNSQQANKTIEEQKYRGVIYDLKDQAISLIGKDIFNLFIKDNIQKTWGRECPNLPPFIIPDVPINYHYDTNYFFQDKYQGIPVGCYNALFDVLLNDTEVEYNTDFIPNKERYLPAADKIIFTGRIDEFYNYIYTSLEYRTVRWEHFIKDVANYQGSAIIHYPELNINYTRVVEHKHFDPYNKEIQEKNKTVVSYEYYEEWNEDKECLYPLGDEKNNNVYLKYKDLAENETKIYFRGRLGTYKYYDMNDIIEEVLNEFS